MTLENQTGYPRLERTVLAQLSQELRAATPDASISGILITGSDKAFAVGAEINELALLTPIAAHDFSLFGQSVMSQIERLPKPVIAAIRGFCFGGGLDLALACHLRIASADAQFAHPGGSLGILTGWGGTQRLPRTLLPGARSRGLEIFATARTLTAQEALHIGLISRVVPAPKVISEAIALISKEKSAGVEHPGLVGP